MTIYPTIDEVISTHSILIARFGGAVGVRDHGALESALARPQSGYYSDVIQEAAVLWESLSQKFILPVALVNEPTSLLSERPF